MNHERFDKIEPFITLFFLTVFEVISVLFSPILGNWLHAALLIWLVYRGSLHANRDVGKLLISLSVCPMIRMVSFSISPRVFPGIWYYSITEAIILFAACFAVAVNGYTLRDIGLRVSERMWTIPFVLFSGFTAGWVEARIIHPTPMTPGLLFSDIWFPSLMLIVFTGFAEEFLFRGVIQHAASVLYKPWVGILFTAFTWALLHVTWLSWLEVLFICAVGVLWGALRHYNRSIVFLSLAHGIANIMLFIVMPHLF